MSLVSRSTSIISGGVPRRSLLHNAHFASCGSQRMASPSSTVIRSSCSSFSSSSSS
eukprot:CAMPEP_0197603646 /NCGR_PEP_ID=MMETSP1326-20131121/39613_1 /TAXON_ID=1155430 /ORGANISM="Genus nov. species nov., Strain RCC2288" /LENGTH=55 /DNA_ID=CAMNT_0043171181 /DNA_START=30 /DNA_END=194 /DNA_ORIENTATION=-